ncbi:TPA: CfaE/CblD family pilus tip adhesin [Stenotrophomonas maltophilia]
MSAPDTRLWPEELFVLGFDSLRPERQFSRLHFVCLSSSDTQHGACMLEGAPGATDRESEIPVRFTEERSGRTMDLRISGHLRRVGSSRHCGWLGTKHGLQSNDPGTCAFIQVDGSGVSARLPGSELDKLMPGHWRASLILNLRSGTASTVLATYTFNFSVDVTDISGAAVYFPDRPVAIPRVGLNLRRSTTTPATISGEATLDMCLYDGRGSVSPYLELQVRDEGRDAPGRAPGMHSVYRRGGGEEAGDRIDFEALLNYEGSALPMNNGDTVMLHGTDSARLRPVRLPGMLDTVYCVPAPLTLRTPAVSADSKSAGFYEGRLTVQMTVPTTTP